MKENITFTHSNGYSAVLYEESSMCVYNGRRKVLHTGSRNVNTEAEVMELLEKMPEFCKKNNRGRVMLQVGDTIECVSADDAINTMQILAKEGVETDFLYEKDGQKGLWLVVCKID